MHSGESQLLDTTETDVFQRQIDSTVLPGPYLIYAGTRLKTKIETWT